MRALGALVLLTVLAAGSEAAAQSVTAFKVGDESTGMTRQCYYDALGSGYSITISSVHICPLSIQVRLPEPAPPAAPPQAPSISPGTTTGFYQGEEVTGMTKQCYYDALGSAYTKTVSSVALCPLAVRVRLP